MGPICVAVFDDDETHLNVLRLILEEEGYRVVSSLHPSDARDLVKAARASLVITDMLFHGKSEGRQVVEALRADPQTALLPVIVTTALLPDDETVEALAVDGAVRVVPKPFDLDELVGAVAALVHPASAVTTAPRPVR